MSINKLKLKRSAVTGRYPDTASLDLGELAINTFDGKVFLKKDNGTQTIIQLADVSGSILSASYAQTSSHSNNFTVRGPLNVYGSQTISGSLTVTNDITAQRLIVQTVSSSVIYSSGSNVFGNNLTDTQKLTGSVSITGSFKVNGTIGNFTGSTNFLPKFFDPNNLNNSIVYQSGSSIAINETNFTNGNPEALYVFQTHPTSYNVITGRGNSNNYLQLNIQNTNNGTSASADIVATANNGTESDLYIDMGINNQNYVNNGNGVGTANDAYLYSTGNHLHIGNAKSGKHLGFFVGGFDAETNKKLQLNSTGAHQLTGSLDANSQITASAFVTRGATAAQFVKGDGTLDSTVYVSSSIFNSTTGSLNNFSASILNATASLYAATASLYAASASINTFSASMNAFTASQRVLNGTYATTASNTFYGTETVIGNIVLTGSANITGSVNVVGGGFNVNGVNVLDTALAYAIALG